MKDENKSCFGCRLAKLVMWFALGSLALVLLMAATLPLWISPVATSIAGKVVPRYTGTDFSIDRFYVNPYSGSLCINGVSLSNPKGFGKSEAFALSSFSMDVSLGSLLSDTVLVKEVVIDGAFASYYSHNGKNNFDVIHANVEQAMGPKKDAGQKEAEEDKSGTFQKKIIIEKLRIAGTKVKLMKSDMMPPLALPSIELTDIGKKTNGATLDEAWMQIADAVMKSVASIGDGIGALGAFLGEGTQDFSAVFGKGAASDASSSAGSAIKGAAKGTVDAVGDTAKKATEGVKNLFNGFGK